MSTMTKLRPLCAQASVISKTIDRVPCMVRGLKTSGSGSQQSKNEGPEHDRQNTRKRVAAVLLAATVGAGVGVAWALKHHERKTLSSFGRLSPVYASDITPGIINKSLPTYTADQIANHSTPDKGVWVYYKNGVYDITEFAEQHPGGRKYIMMAAGKSIEPFWDLYAVHKMEEVYEILESMRIGNILEIPQQKEKEKDSSDPYKNDPERSSLLIPSSSKPFNAEPPQALLVDKFLTPNHLFFVRNHLPVPDVKPENYRLKLDLESGNESMTLDDLKKKFKKTAVTAVTQCAGNRRSEMVKVKPVKGLNWGSAAISNAKWSGVCLDDLLKSQNVDIEKARGKFVVFEGMDLQPDGTPYGASIPIDLARLLKRDIIIAYQMNNQDIPRDHGYPVRVIIPGVVGARQVKWLNKIYLSTEESTSHWQRRDYKGFNSSIDWHNVDFDKSVSISQLPVISAICEPEEGAVLEEGSEEVSLKGYAWSGGGRGIIRVDVSADGGKTWHNATLKPNNQSLYKSWAWTLWEADVPLPPGADKTQLICKAVDVSYNVQPDTVEGIWNLRGCLSNAWHRVNISVPAES